MTQWALNTEFLPAPERPLAWEGAMQRLRLANTGGVSPDGLRGHISWATSARGTEFAHLRAGPQSLSGRDPDQPPGIWVGIVVDGQACLDQDGILTRLTTDTILFGPTGIEAALRFTTPFRLLLITIPGRLLAGEIGATPRVEVTRIGQQNGLQRIFFDLLHATAREIDDLSVGDLRHLESACTELLIGTLPATEGSLRHQPTTPSLRRIREAVDDMLDDPDLTLGQLSSRLGLSCRYLQKQFATGGQTFTLYVLRRRLERCQRDLANPALAGRSISEICFTRGFNDAAHFSRSFRAAYAMSPRQFRAGKK